MFVCHHRCVGVNFIYQTRGHYAESSLTAGGWPIAQSQFMPFGTEISPPVIEDHYRFTGRERDTELGLDYFGARYYASSMGRWMSPDWSEKVEAVPHAVLTNPQSLNLYQYGLDRDPTSSEKREC